MKKLRNALMLLVSVMLLVSCSSINSITSLKNLNIPKELRTHKGKNVKTVEKEFLCSPIEYMGVEETVAIRTGHYTIKKVLMSEALWAEFFRWRIRWKGIFIDETTNQVFTAQAVISAKLDSVLRPYFYLIIDGDKLTGLSDLAKGGVLSSGFGYFYNKDGTEYKISSPEEYADSPEYRARIANKHGSTVRLMENSSEDIVKQIKTWHSFTWNGKKIYTPYSKEQLEKVAIENPQYDVADKYIEHARAMLSPDPYAMALSTIMDAYAVATAHTTGADYKSKLSGDRREIYTETVAIIIAMYRGSYIRDGLAIKFPEDKFKVSKKKLKPVIKLKDKVKTNLVTVGSSLKHPKSKVLESNFSNFGSKSKVNSGWAWDRSLKEVYWGNLKRPIARNSFEENRDSIRKALRLMRLPRVFQERIVEAWRFGNKRWITLHKGVSVKILITGKGIVRQDVPTAWKDVNTLQMEVFGEYNKMLVGQVSTGHWACIKKEEVQR